MVSSVPQTWIRSDDPIATRKAPVNRSASLDGDALGMMNLRATPEKRPPVCSHLPRCRDLHRVMSTLHATRFHAVEGS